MFISRLLIDLETASGGNATVNINQPIQFLVIQTYSHKNRPEKSKVKYKYGSRPIHNYHPTSGQNTPSPVVCATSIYNQQ